MAFPEAGGKVPALTGRPRGWCGRAGLGAVGQRALCCRERTWTAEGATQRSQVPTDATFSLKQQTFSHFALRSCVTQNIGSKF